MTLLLHFHCGNKILSKPRGCATSHSSALYIHSVNLQYKYLTKYFCVLWLKHWEWSAALVLDALQLKRSQSVKMKRFSHRSICFPPLTYRHKLWVVFVTESMTPLMQAAGMSFLQMLCGPHSIWRKLKPSETGWRAPSFTNKRSWLRWFRYFLIGEMFHVQLGGGLENPLVPHQW